MPKIKDLTGQRFGNWTVVSRAESDKDNRGFPVTKWHCKCDCGTERDVYANSLLSGRSTSCGCHAKQVRSQFCTEHFKTHGDSKSRLYQIWYGIHKRCTNENASNYSLYGGRGISVCSEWDNWDNFKEWAMENGYAEDLSIDRIDVNGNYCPDNCRWVTRVDQANNRRSNAYITYNNETHTIAEWANIFDVPYKRLYKRLHKGAPLEQAVK